MTKRRWISTACGSAGVVAILTATAIWATRPLAWNMDQLAWDLGDPMYAAFALHHNYRVLANCDWANYWQAPAFTPYPQSLVVADAHLGTAVWTWPIYLATGDALVAYNFAVLASFVLTGLGLYALALLETNRRWLALAIAVAGAVTPFRLAQLGHLQVVATQWTALALVCLLRCARSPSPWYVVGVGACVMLTTTSSLYYGLLQWLLLGPVCAFCFVRGRWFKNDRLLRAFVWTTLVVGAATFAFVLPYYVVYRDESLGRRLDEVIQYSARFVDYFQVTPWNATERLPLLRTSGRHEGVEHTLFPGLVLAAGLFVAVALLTRPKEACLQLLRRIGVSLRCIAKSPARMVGIGLGAALALWWVFLFPIGLCRIDLGFDYLVATWTAVSVTSAIVLAIAVGLILSPAATRAEWLGSRDRLFWQLGGIGCLLVFSFGPLVYADHNGSELAIGPYALLYRFVPGWTGMRVPARIQVLLLPLFVLVASRAWTTLLDQRYKFASFITRMGVLAALAGDLAIRPIDWTHVPVGNDLPRSVAWLCASETPGAVVVLPTGNMGAEDPLYLYYSTIHGRRMLNGYAAFMPADCRDATAKANHVPNEDALDMLSHRGIRYVVLDCAHFPPARIALCRQSARLRPQMIEPGGRFIVYELLSTHE